MNELKLAPDIAARLSKFIRSDQFSIKNSSSKSEYWKYHADQLSIDLDEGSASVTGAAGFYVPPPSSFLRRIAGKVLLALKNPSRATNWFRRLVSRYFSCMPRLMTYKKAFDAVMSHAEISDPDRSRFRINHLDLVKLNGVLPTSKMIQQYYSSWSGYAANDSVINHYYHQNILRKYVGDKKINTIMEIGAGNGNFPALFFHDWAPVRVILVDLPETLAIAIPYLSNLFPDARLIMPHEVQVGALADDFDFAFLTVDQLDYIDDDSVDLSINCDSFQEMTHDQIKTYFHLVQRVTREAGLFFTANRVEKIPGGPDSFMVDQVDPPNRFADYPWNDGNEILAFEISRLIRLVQLDDMYLRIERIHK